MGLLHQCFEVFEGAKFRVHSRIVGHSVVAAQLALALEFANGLNGHEPKNVHPHLMQAWKVRCECVQSALGGVLTDIDFVDVGTAGPGNVLHESKILKALGKKFARIVPVLSPALENSVLRQGRHTAIEAGLNRLASVFLPAAYCN